MTVIILGFFVTTEAQSGESLEWSYIVEQELVDQIAKNDLARKVYAGVVRRLRQYGIPADFVKRTFSHPDIRIEDEVKDRFDFPAEQKPYEDYRKIFITQDRISEGKEFYKKYKSLIESVADSFGVDPLIITSIIGVESKFGSNAEVFPVFNALHTIIHRLPQKELWVEKEMAEYIKFCYDSFIPPMSVYGSYAGAFGYGQFIPSSFNYYAIDFNGDGIRNPFDWPDVIASIANYLVKNGYRKESKDFSKNSPNWRAILSYNPSVNYVMVVLEFREELKKAIG